MKITKHFRFLIVVIISTQSLFCATQSTEIPTKLNIQTIIEKQVNKDLIKYDADKDEITIFVGKEAYRKDKQFIKGLRIAYISIIVLAALLMIPNNQFEQLYNLICKKIPKLSIPSKASLLLLGTGMLGLMLTEGILSQFILSPIPKLENFPGPIELFKFTPVGLEIHSSFVMSWQDVGQSIQMNVKGLCPIHPSETTTVVSYKTKNNSRLLDLDETNDPFCTVSSKDLQELINYYIAKYGNTQATPA